MTSELFWIYGFNIIVNSILSFFTITFLVIALIFILRVKNHRIKAMLFCVPFLKLILDVFFYDFSNWALTHQINPYLAEKGSRTFSLMFWLPSSWQGTIPVKTGILMLMDNGTTFSVADLLSYCIDPLCLKIIVLIFAAISLGTFARGIFKYIRSTQHYFQLINCSNLTDRQIDNHTLRFYIRNENIKILISPTLTVPCAYGILQKYILFPEGLVNKLTQKEYEAIIAHESEHLQWYDNIVRLLSRSIRFLFWWVPSRWCLNKLELAQEYACDYIMHKFYIAKVDLASAILKAAKAANLTDKSQVLVTCFVNESSTFKRIQRILCDAKPPQRAVLRWPQNLLIILAIATIISGRFWIF